MLRTDDRTLRSPTAGGGSPTRHAACAAAGLTAAGALHALPALAFHSPHLRARLGVESDTRRHGYALTFDDGPHALGTPAVLEVLAAARVHATFFLVGEQVQRNPSLVGEILAAGHGLGLHCHRHRNLLRLTPRQTLADLRRAQAIVEQASQLPTTLYRPPYGILNATALAHARRSGWRTLLWSHWGRDWEARATADSIASLVTDGVRAGSLLLLHDADDYSAPGSWRHTVAALPRVLDTLAARGLQAVAP
jgi:peptidoglycan/xylan/chitin deacetylase (PgdA/CDA1 family)